MNTRLDYLLFAGSIIKDTDTGKYSYINVFDTLISSIDDKPQISNFLCWWKNNQHESRRGNYYN